MTNRRSHLILVGLLLAALVGAALLIVPGSPLHKSVKKGLDLQGGLEVVLEAVPPPGHELTTEELDRSVSIMRERVDKLGVSEPEIRKQGSDQIVIQLAGVKNPEDAAGIIGKTAQLELYDLEPSLEKPSVDIQQNPVETADLYALLYRVRDRAEQGKPTAYYLFDQRKRLALGPAPSRDQLLRGSLPPKKKGQPAQQLRGKVPKGYSILAVPARTVVVTCGVDAGFCPGGPNGSGVVPDRTYYYLFKHGRYDGEEYPAMKGEDLKLSGIRAEFGTQNEGPVVLMQFTDEGNDKFHEITKREYVRGQATQRQQHFAIVLDNEIKSFPQIDFTDPTLNNGIDPTGTGAQIQGIETFGEAKDLALVLQTGALPVDFEQKERTVVSATLGKDSLEEAQRAAIAGLLVVALFLLLVYRFLGLVAVIGLGIYGTFLYSVLLLLDVTLTLPGFAGMILTIGVAADANIVIFERIKEEARAGKSVRAAISSGYGKGFGTILDANVVTLITALVLFAVATAGVKGFALMLIIGTIISLVTAVAATRAMLGLLGGFRWFENPQFMGAQGQQGLKWLQIDFIGRRRTWFAISAAVLALGAVSLAVKGLNLGIDFKGGTQITFRTPEPTSLSKVRTEIAAFGQESAVVQGRGAAAGPETYKSFQIRTEEIGPGEQGALMDRLRTNVGIRGEEVNTVSSSFGRQIANSAILAILFSLFLIVLYIAVRFDIKFAVPMIAALVHDVLITVGIYSFTGREVTTSTVAAVLTVLGYSIYDTIIISDRIRENVPLMRRSPFAHIANVSLWETIRRSLATTFITLLPIMALFFFGGATLKDFAFALLVGIGAGAYSSIFIAPQLLTIWKEREPEWAKRKETGGLGPERPDEGGTPARRRPIRPGGAPSLETSPVTLEEATEAAAWTPTPPPFGDPSPQPAASGDGDAKRQRRRERRRARPHGRPR